MDLKKDFARFDSQCMRLRDERLSGSVTLTVKFAAGMPVHCTVSRSLQPVALRPVRDDEAVAAAVQELWRELSREDKKFFGEISISKLYACGKLVLMNESSAISSKA
jgi:hypothetical protein